MAHGHRSGVLVRTLEVDWGLVEREFSERRISTLFRQMTDAGLPVAFLEDALQGEQRARDDRERSFATLWHECAARPAGTTRLTAFYVYARAQLAWELTADHGPIGDTLTAAWRTWSEHRTGDPSDEQRDVALTLRHACSLIAAMQAEDALNCSCPDRLADLARQVEDTSADLLAELTDEAAAPFGRMLSRLLESHERYYRGVHTAARAVSLAIDDPRSAADELEKAAREVAGLEAALGDDVYASELRPHRQVLEATRDRLHHLPGPPLRLRELRLVYVYPFHLDLGGRATSRLGDSQTVGSAVVRDLQLSDVWKVDRVSQSEDPDDAADPGDGLTGVYDGKVLAVGHLHLGDGAGALGGDYEVEVHLNDPGNHYVRISSALVHDATLHELNQGIRRGSVHMGTEDMTAPLLHGEPGVEDGHGTVAAYVERLVASLARTLPPPQRARPATPRAVRCALDVERDGHVLVEIQSATLGEREATAEDLLAHAGRLLWQPIQNYATALEEWLLLPPATEQPTNILGFAAQRHELGMSSNHVTVLFSPHAPSWKLLGYKELVEFCVTLPCLLRGWIRQLDVQTKGLREEGRQADLAPTIAQLEAQEARLHDTRLDFTAQALDIRIVRERLERVAAAANRALMRNMLAAVHMSAYDRALDARFELHEMAASTLAQRTRSIREQLEAEARRKDEQHQGRVNSLLHAITILGLAGFLSYLNSLFTESPPRWIWAAVELPLLVLLGFLLWWSIRRRDDTVAQHRTGRTHRPGSRGAI